MISAVIFDLDGTLTKTPSPWRHIHERLGVWDNTACGYFDEWLSGRISYDEFCRRDARLWSGRSVREIETFLDEIAWNRHVPAVVEHLVAASIPSIIISSGFKYIATKIQVRHGWELLEIHANDLLEGPEVCINVSGDSVSPISKRALAAEALARIGVTFEKTLVVSDTERDLEALRDCRYKLLIEREDDLLRVREFVGSNL